MLNEIKAYFKIPMLNSIRFAEQVEWNNYDKPKKVENTLSYQEDGENNKQFYQLFQYNDAIRIQFKSTYETHVIRVHGCDSSVTNITPVKRTDSLDILDRRSAGVLDYNTFTAVYFGVGDIVDAEDGTTIIGPDNSGEYVPDWMEVGKNVLLISTSEHEATITDIVWLESQSKYAVVTNVLYSTFDPVTSLHVKSQYNKEDYDIYEFDLDFFSYSEGKYQIEIQAQDANFDSLVYLSERIKIQETHEETHLIIHENEDNHQINYTWGIQHMFRLPYEMGLKYSPSGENEIHNTDTNTLLIDSTTYENYEVEFKPVPTAIAIMLSEVFGQTNVFIDTKSYVSKEKPEIEKLENANLYKCKVQLILSNEEYDNKNIDFSTMPDHTFLKLSNGGYLRLGGVTSGFLALD